MKDWLNRFQILYAPDTGEAGAFTEASDEETEEIEVVFTPDGNLPPDPNAEAPPEPKDLQTQIAESLAQMQTQTPAQAAPPQTLDPAQIAKAMVEAQNAQQTATNQGKPFDLDAYVAANKDKFFKDPGNAFKEGMQTVIQNMIAPAMQQLQSQNTQLAAQLNKRAITDSPMNKQVMEDYGDEVEKRAKELLAQGNTAPYEQAVKDVGWNHMAEITQKQAQAAIEKAASEKVVAATPPSGMSPSVPPATKGKRTIALSEAEKQRADTIGMDYADYARFIGKIK